MKIWIVWAISIAVYFGLNAAALFGKSGIPGMATMIGWGYALPIVLILAWWVLANTTRGDLGKKWWILGLLSTVIFAAAGYATIRHIAAIWASI